VARFKPRFKRIGARRHSLPAAIDRGWRLMYLNEGARQGQVGFGAAGIEAQCLAHTPTDSPPSPARQINFLIHQSKIRAVRYPTYKPVLRNRLARE
jgi:hypothetical protein